jgi:tetratricopeptide (TPR) repeat protein
VDDLHAKTRLGRLILPLFPLLALTVGPAAAHPQLAVVLEGLNRRIAAQPNAWDLRARRAWLQVDHGNPDSAEADIQALLPRKEWKGEALFLEAWRLLLVGKAKEARPKIQESLKLKPSAERYRILSRVELSLGKPDLALAAAEKAHKLGGGDEDLLAVLEAHKAKGRIPRDLWVRTMDDYPGHPAVMEALFGFCLNGGKASPSGGATLESCEDLTAQACTEWWPESVDWRVNRARVLLALGRGKEVKPLLAEALDKLDDSRAGGDSEHATAMRKEIFDLMKAAKGR